MRNFKNKPLFFRFVVRIINLFYHKRSYTGVENLQSPTMVITNHSQIHAPLTHTLFFPTDAYFWCISDMLDYKKIHSHAYHGFWEEKPKSTKWLFKIASYLITPLAWFFKRANLIPVYHDLNIKKTINITFDKLNEGHDVIICPEKWTGFDGIINDLFDNFVDIARLYHKKYGICVSFTPMYTCPALKTNLIGKAITFNPDNNIVDERKRVTDYIKASINELAKTLPPHRVVPFVNVGKKEQTLSK